jgi:L-alanine-DL-glutamate epimerase-like enolase superfamily enzyme
VPQGCFDTAPYPGVYLDPMDIDSDGFVHAPKKPGLGFGIDFVEAKKITDQTVVV